MDNRRIAELRCLWNTLDHQERASWLADTERVARLHGLGLWIMRAKRWIAILTS